jgi:hypothetical protein
VDFAVPKEHVDQLLLRDRLVDYFSDPDLLCVFFDRVVAECSHRHHRALLLCLVLHERLLLEHGFEPVLLSRLNVCANLISVHAWHLDVGQDEVERSRAACKHQALLEALDGLRACVEDNAFNLEVIEHHLECH